MVDVDCVAEGRKVLEQEAKGLKEVASRLDSNFEKAVKLLNECKGKVIVTGIGKSGIIGRKIASTLASIGTAAFFMHPSEAVHGDLGMVTDQDLVILISKSGETSEILNILPNLKALGAKTIGIVGNPNSTLGKKCDVVLDAGVSEECDPNNLIPTTSTTATLAIGDALAMALMKIKQFKPEDLAIFHPGGIIGKRLTLKVADLMYTGDKLPKISKESTVKDAILVLTKIGLGITAVVDENDILLGVFTDGDLRRLIQKRRDFIDLPITQVMTPNPKTTTKDELAVDALKRLRDHGITSLIVVDENRRVIGILDIYKVLGAGIA
jgi:arabinose-5-phosphate isomerase